MGTEDKLHFFFIYSYHYLRLKYNLKKTLLCKSLNLKVYIMKMNTYRKLCKVYEHTIEILVVQ